MVPEVTQGPLAVGAIYWYLRRRSDWHGVLALAYAADYDLKPANALVFLSGGGTKMTTKIGDVGLARFAATSTASRRGTVGAGTLYYMAPEVMFGRYNHAVDVFSFGVMMAEIVVTKMKSPPMRTGDMDTRFDVVESAVAFLRPLCEPLAVMIEGCCRTDVTTRLTASAALELVRSASTTAAVC
jgi:serine/threonine protein kinase